MVKHQKLCECGCGKPAPIAVASNFTRGVVKGQPLRFIKGHHLKRIAAARRVDLAKQRFGRLTAIRLTDSRGGRWEVKCECGAVLSATAARLRSGKMTSCGCVKQ